MTRHILFAAALLAAVAVAAALRLPDLGNRTMHCDEANQAVMFGRLLERGEYRYDPHEHHGPTLLYATLPVAWAASANTLAELSEVPLRLVPALAGILLVALAWLARDALGPVAAASTALLAAASPAMVFYSRYYVMEMLLVTCTFAGMVAWWRFLRFGHNAATMDFAHKAATGGRGFMAGIAWLALLGVCIGLMHATKETCIIALAAMGAATAVSVPGWWRFGKGDRTLLCDDQHCASVPASGPFRQKGPVPFSAGLKRLGLAALIVGLVGAAVSALFFSSFFDHPRGVADSYTAFASYAGRASGEGSAGPQVKPWYYYLDILFWRGGQGAFALGEIAIAALALLGLLAALVGNVLKPENRSAARFVTVYAVLMTVVYSAMPYKTPWSVLGMLHGIILLAGVGASALVRLAPGYLLKGVAVLVLAAGLGHLAWAAWQTGFVYQDDAEMNPYLHTPTARSALRLAERVHEVAAVHPDGLAMHVQVVCPDADYWPLPWYLRDMPRIGWYGEVPTGPAAPLIITRPEFEAAIVKYLYEEQPPGERHLMVPFPPQREPEWLLRAGIPLEVFIRHELLDAYRSGPPADQPTPQAP